MKDSLNVFPGSQIAFLNTYQTGEQKYHWKQREILIIRSGIHKQNIENLPCKESKVTRGPLEFALPYRKVTSS